MNIRMALPWIGRTLAASIAVSLWAARGFATASSGDSPEASGNLPPTVQITCPTPSPLNVFVSIPALRVHWEGHDPDGAGARFPAKYKFILLGPSSEFPVSLALANPDSLRRYYARHPLGPWAGWDSTGSGNPSAALANLIPNTRYVFVVIAFDRMGNYSPVFSL
jgi:hypothetical protein